MPEIDVFAGESDTVEVLVAEPCWLFAWRTTDEQGHSWLSVYRSVLVRDTDPVMLETFLLGAGEELRTEVVTDAEMLGGAAVLSLISES